jgi:hypothetical protein
MTGFNRIAFANPVKSCHPVQKGASSMRWGLLIVGVLMLIVGGVWFFQGIGILLGSRMTNDPFWAVVGGIVVVVGAVLAVLGLRRRAAGK